MCFANGFNAHDETTERRRRKNASREIAFFSFRFEGKKKTVARNIDYGEYFEFLLR
jgi:hypothetical protein